VRDLIANFACQSYAIFDILYYQMPNWQPTSSGNNKLTNPSPKWIHTMLEEFILSLFRLMGEQVSGQKKLAQLQVS
jgi:Tfp pilus assembly protein PilP